MSTPVFHGKMPAVSRAGIPACLRGRLERRVPANRKEGMGSIHDPSVLALTAARYGPPSKGRGAGSHPLRIPSGLWARRVAFVP